MTDESFVELFGANLTAGAAPFQETGLAPTAAIVADTPVFAHDGWTRLGGDAVVGDKITDDLFAQLESDVRRVAHEEGYRDGLAEGQREALEAAQIAAERQSRLWQQREDERQRQHEDALATLARAAQVLVEAVDMAVAVVGEHALETAVAVTEKVTRHALGADTRLVVANAHAVLEETAGQSGLVLRVSRHDYERIAADLAGKVDISVDHSFAPGDVMADFDTGCLDARVQQAVQRVIDELTAAAQGTTRRGAHAGSESQA